MSTDHALSVLAQDEKPAVARLIDWLKIPSISTDPAYRDQTRRAAEWVAEQLRQCGLAVEISETGAIGPDGRGSGHPIVLATTHGTPDQWRQQPHDPRHVLFYGHYDVQPADPLELWESPPFEPVIKPASGEIGERIVARGAVDDKGQVMMFIEALRAWKAATGKVAGGARFTVLLEGEEESGSVNLEAWVKARTEMLSRCKVCLISDTGMLGRERPAITYGVRGLSYTEVVLHGPNQDLHSGLWGGRSPNPINELTKVLGRLWDADRRVTLPGFYSDVRPLTEGERENWRKLGVDAHAALAKIGLPPEADIGEKGYTSTEREWARPTAEINGIVGGYTGKGAKTVIPAFASAKVSFRLVADQDPGKVTRSFFDWCKANTPPGCRWEFIDHSGGFPATVQTDSPFLAAASRAVEKAAGKKPELIKSGGSIPVAGMLKGLCGLETVFMGFGLDDDRVHSPNEKFELACYRMGARSHTALIGELLSMKG